LRKHHEHDETLNALDAELLTLDVSPEAERIRRYKDTSDRAYHRSMAAMLRLRKTGITPKRQAHGESTAELSIVTDQDVESSGEPLTVDEEVVDENGIGEETQPDPESEEWTVHIDRSAGASDQSEMNGLSGSEPTADDIQTPESEPTAGDGERQCETRENVELHHVTSNGRPAGDPMTAGSEATAAEPHTSVGKPIVAVCDLTKDPLVEDLEILARYDQYINGKKAQDRKADNEGTGVAKRAERPFESAGLSALTARRPMNRKERRRLRAQGKLPPDGHRARKVTIAGPTCASLLADQSGRSALEALAIPET
jgi:hypothetical protein